MFETLKDYSKSEKRKIGIFTSFMKGFYFTSSFIRILSPLNELSDEFELEIIDDTTRKKFMRDLDNGDAAMDAIIIGRDIDVITKDIEYVKTLYEKLKKNNIKIIFDIDDNILIIDETHTYYSFYSRLIEMFRFLIENSDVITVSTPHLRQTLLKYNENIEVIPNTLMNKWDFNPNGEIRNLTSKHTIKIGYFGTRTHGSDLKLLEGPIKNIRKHFSDRNIEFEVVGITKSGTDWFSEIVLPNNYKKNPSLIDSIINLGVKAMNKVNLMKWELPYIQFINWMKNEIDWDIGLAPLQDNKFNRNKSNLKYLEYSALNIPAIFSDIEPYKDIKTKNSGLVIKNTEEEWENALIELIENQELYETLVANSKKDISQNYLVENSSQKWRKILKEFV